MNSNIGEYKKLPVELNIPIKSYLHHMNPLSVILANDEKAIELVKYRFLQLCFNQKDPSLKLDFYAPFRYQCLDDGHIKEAVIKSDIIISAKNLINDGYYLTFVADEYFIKNTRAFNNFHFNHWLFIYGYNSTGFYCLGYLKSGKYEKFFVANNTFVNAVKTQFGIGVYKAINNFNYEYDNILATELLTDYLCGHNTSNKFRLHQKPINALFGINIYDGLIQDLKNAYDIRYPQVLTEHKEFILEYIRHNFIDRIDYITEMNKIIYDCKKLKNIYIKQRIKENKNKKNEIVNLINKIKTREIIVLENIIKL